jgi:hypothetical protein
MLKDHQVRELINRVRDAVQPIIPRYQPLWEVIAGAVTGYLNQHGLRADVCHCQSPAGNGASVCGFCGHPIRPVNMRQSHGRLQTKI